MGQSHQPDGLAAGNAAHAHHFIVIELPTHAQSPINTIVEQTITIPHQHTERSPRVILSVLFQ